MKKVILFAAVATAFSFASCKKEHDCRCTYTTTFGGVSTTSTSTETYKDVTKKNAKTLCVSSTSTSDNGVVTTSSCTVE
jgi:hypothetical protein